MPKRSAVQPLKTVHASAPVRVCDLGGWTDTWFAGHGAVLNIAVSPRVEVQIDAYRREQTDFDIRFLVENYGDEYDIKRNARSWAKHPLLEACALYLKPPRELALRIAMHSDAPPGASIGTSAAASVALLAALHAATSTAEYIPEPAALAQDAHHVETVLLKRQSGIQDQLAAAHGGVSFITMPDFPNATVETLRFPESLAQALQRRLMLVYFGASHDSSEVHSTVIRDMEHRGPDNPLLEALRQTAQAGRDALMRGDLNAFGKTMIRNTETQGQLHPSLVNPDAEKTIRIAKRFGATGWKVNGAGGDGGSITILSPDDLHMRIGLQRAIEAASPLYRCIPIALQSQGVLVEMM